MSCTHRYKFACWHSELYSGACQDLTAPCQLRFHQMEVAFLCQKCRSKYGQHDILPTPFECVYMALRVSRYISAACDLEEPSAHGLCPRRAVRAVPLLHQPQAALRAGHRRCLEDVPVSRAAGEQGRCGTASEWRVHLAFPTDEDLRTSCSVKGSKCKLGQFSAESNLRSLDVFSLFKPINPLLIP